MFFKNYFLFCILQQNLWKNVVKFTEGYKAENIKRELSNIFLLQKYFLKINMERSRMCFNFMYKKYFLRMLLQGFKKYDDARLINAFFLKTTECRQVSNGYCKCD